MHECVYACACVGIQQKTYSAGISNSLSLMKWYALFLPLLPLITVTSLELSMARFSNTLMALQGKERFFQQLICLWSISVHYEIACEHTSKISFHELSKDKHSD